MDGYGREGRGEGGGGDGDGDAGCGRHSRRQQQQRWWVRGRHCGERLVGNCTCHWVALDLEQEAALPWLHPVQFPRVPLPLEGGPQTLAAPLTLLQHLLAAGVVVAAAAVVVVVAAAAVVAAVAAAVLVTVWSTWNVGGTHMSGTS